MYGSLNPGIKRKIKIAKNEPTVPDANGKYPAKNPDAKNNFNRSLKLNFSAN